MKNIRIIKGVFILFVVINVSGCSQKVPVLSTSLKEPVKKIYDVQGEAREASLWPGETSRNMLFVDSKANEVGDIVTILISENSSATKSATTDTAKDSSQTITTGGLFGLPSHLGLANLFGLGSSFDPSMSTTNSNDFSGSGTTTRQDQFTATLAATIVEILPNGNFRIEGKRKVSLNNEAQDLTLSGMIRPVDIAFDNTIGSQLIANARIEYSGSGVLADKQRVGWGIRILDLLWPF